MHNFVNAATVGLAALAATGAASSDKEPKTFDWKSVNPAKDLEYHDCYDGFKCARLILPLDYQNEDDNRTIALAVIKYPAVVADDDPKFGGSIFLNPGGPGGSGVDFIQGRAKMIRRTVDKPDRRHYELVSFDPRGLANSWPRADCFVGDVLARDASGFEMRGNGRLDDGQGAVPYALALWKGISHRCKDAEDSGINGGAIMPYMSTPSVARDMVEMVDKIEELRKRERAAKHLGGVDDSHGEFSTELKKRSDDEEGDVARLQYWGFSYGTILGNYFASLFPGRVGRIILDGVSNAEDYSTGPGWTTNLVDTDEIFENFFVGCHKAGPSACALARKDDKSVSQLSDRFYKWLNDLDDSPMAEIGPSGTVVALTGRDVRSVIGSVLYKPLDKFQILAETLDQAMTGNATALLNIVLDSSIPKLKDACPIADGPEPEISRDEGGASVLCADGDDVTGYKTAKWRKYVRKQISMSSIFGDYWCSIRMGCSSWPFKSNWVFKGPFTTPEAKLTADGKTVPGRPAAPILFMTNRLDPVTPLSAARAMAANHPGAGLVVQEAMGHCTLSAGEGECVKNIVADYLEFGNVPKHETACEVPCGPWDEGCAKVDAAQTGSDDPILKLRRWPLGFF